MKLNYAYNSSNLMYIIKLSGIISVADPGFPGAPTPKVGVLTYYFTNFCQKLHEMKEFGPPGESLASPPLDPPLQMKIIEMKSVKTCENKPKQIKVKHSYFAKSPKHVRSYICWAFQLK